jgi:hypothetical protein
MFAAALNFKKLHRGSTVGFVDACYYTGQFSNDSEAIIL